jgi:hypothetical protein
MLERSEGLADRTEHPLQNIQGIHPHVYGAHPISQLSLDISPIWTPITEAEVIQLQLRPL